MKEDAKSDDDEHSDVLTYAVRAVERNGVEVGTKTTREPG